MTNRGPLVVVPGLCVAAYLRPACDALALQGYDVVLLQPPGWPGERRPEQEPRSLAEVAAPLADWLVGEDLREVLLLGQSAGAQLAAHVAAQVPDRVRLLLLQGPCFAPAYRSMPLALRQWLRDLPRERPSLGLTEAPEWLQVGPRRVGRTLRLSVHDAIEHTLRGYGGPVSVLVGEHDPLSTEEWTRGLASSPDLHVVLPGLPHSSPHKDPEGFADWVVRTDERSRGPAFG